MEEDVSVDGPRPRKDRFVLLRFTSPNKRFLQDFRYSTWLGMFSCQTWLPAQPGWVKQPLRWSMTNGFPCPYSEQGSSGLSLVPEVRFWLRLSAMTGEGTPFTKRHKHHKRHGSSCGRVMLVTMVTLFRRGGRWRPVTLEWRQVARMRSPSTKLRLRRHLVNRVSRKATSSLRVNPV